jgi:hypothetical protein
VIEKLRGLRPVEETLPIPRSVLRDELRECGVP